MHQALAATILASCSFGSSKTDVEFARDRDRQLANHRSSGREAQLGTTPRLVAKSLLGGRQRAMKVSCPLDDTPGHNQRPRSSSCLCPLPPRPSAETYSGPPALLQAHRESRLGTGTAASRM